MIKINYFQNKQKGNKNPLYKVNDKPQDFWTEIDIKEIRQPTLQAQNVPNDPEPDNNVNDYGNQRD